MKKLLTVLMSGVLSLAMSSGSYALNVFACEPEWAALTSALGGNNWNIYSATTHLQDPHHIQARPSLIAKARKADLLICSGAELEAGWLPVLLRKSGNPNIQLNGNGHFMASNYVQRLDVRTSVDRSEGDVHAQGNPHVHLDPRRMLQIADALTKKLVVLAPQEAQAIQARHDALKAELTSTMQTLAAAIDAINGKNIIVYHDNWVYLFEWLQLNKVATLEPKPGMPPTTKHLKTLLDVTKASQPDLILYSSYQPSKPAKWLNKRTNIKTLSTAYTLDEWRKPNALSQFYVDTVNTLVDNLTTNNKQ